MDKWEWILLIVFAYIGAVTVTMSLMKIASDADDAMEEHAKTLYTSEDKK